MRDEIIEVEEYSENAITIHFEGSKFILMGMEEEFSSSELVEFFEEMLFQHHAALVGI